MPRYGDQKLPKSLRYFYGKELPTMRILMLGNSLTSANNLPRKLAELLRDFF